MFGGLFGFYWRYFLCLGDGVLGLGEVGEDDVVV